MNHAALRLPARLWLVVCAAILPFGVPQSVQAGCSDAPAAEMDWTGCSKERLMLNDKDMTAGVFENAFLSGTGFNETLLAGANLQRSELVRSSFLGADLTGANLEKSLASRSDFGGAVLRGARLAKAEFLRVNFSKADLTDADLSGGDFYRNDFTDAQLTNADLHDAIMPRAVFSGATMTGANVAGAFLLRANFENVDLSGVIGLEQDQLDLACGDATTTLPAGLTAPAAWPCAKDPQ